MVVFSTTNDLDVSVDHIVTTWGYADAAMVDLQNDTGLCRAALLPGYTVLVAEPGSLVATWGDGTVAGDGHDCVVDHARAASARSSMRSNQSLTSACWTSPSPGSPAPRKCLDPAPERPTTPAGRRTCARAHRRAGVPARGRTAHPGGAQRRKSFRSRKVTSVMPSTVMPAK